MCIKHGPCEELLSRLQSIEEEDINPFDEITEDDIAQEDVSDLQTGLLNFELRVMSCEL